MITKEVIINGRKYWAHVSEDVPPGAYIVVGPPEGLVDSLGLPEPVATTLHNILYDRKIFTFKDISARGIAQGIVNEIMLFEAQKLTEAFANLERETVGGTS